MVFANNPKVACTTIRKVLIDAGVNEVVPYEERGTTLQCNSPFLQCLSVW